MPDFIGLKGDPSDNIPGIPGIGDKTAGQLIAQYGSLEEVIEHADELTPARSRAVTEHAEQARAAKELATMRRDLELDCDPAEPRSGAARPLAAEGDVPALRVPEPAQPGGRARRGAYPPRRAKSTGVAVPWREGELSSSGCGSRRTRIAPRSRPRTRLLSGRGRQKLEGEIVAHDAKALRIEAADDTMIAAYLIEPSRASYELDDLAAEYGVELLPEPEAEEETARLVRHAAATLRLREPLLERVRERGHEQLYREIELPLTPVLVAMEQVGVKIDTYRMGEITARLADRVEELEAKAQELAGEEFMLGSTQQVARILFEKLELTPGRKGKTGYSTDTRVLRTIRGEHEIVP